MSRRKQLAWSETSLSEWKSIFMVLDHDSLSQLRMICKSATRNQLQRSTVPGNSTQFCCVLVYDTTLLLFAQ